MTSDDNSAVKDHCSLPKVDHNDQNILEATSKTTSSTTQTDVTWSHDFKASANEEILPGDTPRLPDPPNHRDWRRPAPRGEWEFCPGTDDSPAQKGVPDPSKFILLRRSADDHTKQDFRLFPSFSLHDWDDPDDVEALNSWRKQIIDRTFGHGKLEVPITQPEKDELLSIIKDWFSSGDKGGVVDWQHVSDEMVRRFIGRVQPKGTLLAQTSYLKEGLEAVRYKSRPKLLDVDRTGSVRRWPENLRLQALKFALVVKEIADNQPPGSKQRRVDSISRFVRIKESPVKRKINVKGDDVSEAVTADFKDEGTSKEVENEESKSPEKRVKLSQGLQDVNISPDDGIPHPEDIGGD